MKTCPICQRDYAEHMRYCTRDGTKLQTENLLNTCPECLLSFPVDVNKCPEHNLELILQANSIEPISFCILCNQYYPPTNLNCPIHGIALKANNLNSASRLTDSPKLLSDSKENISPVVATILEEIIRTDNLSSKSAKLEQVNNLDENLPNPPNPPNPPSIETKQVTSQEVVKAADTKNLTAPAVMPFDTLGQYAIDQVSADRKLFMALALIVVCSVAGFAAYSFPYALQWPKVSADTQPKPSSVALENSSNSEPNSEPNLEQNVSISSEKPVPLEEKEIVQQIEYPKVKQTLSNTLDKESKESKESKAKGESKSSLQAKPKLETTSKDISKSNGQAKSESKSAKKLSTKESKPNVKSTVETVNNRSISKDDQASNNEKPNKGIETSQQRKVSPRVTEPTLSSSQTWDIPVLGQIKAPRRASAKVTAKVVNKSRLQSPNGYVYQFDLVVRELNGVKVKWNYTSAHKSSYSGDNSVVSGLLGPELDANGSIHFRMAVRMTGRCIEDWYGQIVYNCSGIDENGNTVELHQVLALDNNFPTY